MDRQPFWDQLEEHVSKIPQPEPVYLTGDMNVRFQGRHKNDEGILGPFVYGKGKHHIDHTASSDRSLCIKAMQSLSMVEAASFVTPKMVHRITYRDKAAPPTSWSQFILDPLILQQFYSTWQNIDTPASLTVCSIIRSFLTDEAPLPPERLDLHPDPTRFQRLDHFFTRAQWLSSVNSRSPNSTQDSPQIIICWFQKFKSSLLKGVVDPQLSEDMTFPPSTLPHVFRTINLSDPPLDFRPLDPPRQKTTPQ